MSNSPIETKTNDELTKSFNSLSTVPNKAMPADKHCISFYGNITMIYGEAKIGKSYTVGSALSGTGAFFVDIDNNGLDLHKHLLRHGLRAGHGVRALPFLNLFLNYKGNDKYIIIIDSFANFADEFGYNIDKTQDLIKLFKRLREITSLGHAVVLIHHVTTNGKQGKDRESKMQGNAGVILGRVDVVYGMPKRGVLELDRTRVVNATKLYNIKEIKNEIPK